MGIDSGVARHAERRPHHLAAFDALGGHRAMLAAREFAARVLNPPVLGILAGVAVGLSPLGPALFSAGSGGGAAAAAAAAAGGGAAVAAHLLPFELSLARGALRAVVELVELLAAGGLATQTLVLASSLLQRSEGSGEAADDGGMGGAGSSSSGGGGGGGGGSGGFWSAARRLLLPADALEARALGVLCLTRFLIVPAAMLAALRWAAAAGWLRGVVGDPVLLFVIMVQACMPSAQNLIVLLQLFDATRPAAPAFAKMLLKQYAYATLPVTLWVTVLATQLGIPIMGH